MADLKLLVKGEHKLAESALWHEARQCWMWVDFYEPMLAVLIQHQGWLQNEL